MADSKINQQNKKESTIAAAAISSPSGTKSPPPNHQPRPLLPNKQPLRGLKCDHTEEEKNIIEHKLLSGKYPNIATMATDINGGSPPRWWRR